MVLKKKNKEFEVKNPIKIQPKSALINVIKNQETRRLNAERLTVQAVNSVPENKHLFFKEEMDSERTKNIKWLSS